MINNGPCTLRSADGTFIAKGVLTMRGRDRMRLEDIARGQYPPEPRRASPAHARRCGVCGGERDDAGVAAASDDNLLCWPCGLWALAFDQWDDKVEAEARQIAAALGPHQDGSCPPRY